MSKRKRDKAPGKAAKGSARREPATSGSGRADRRALEQVAQQLVAELMGDPGRLSSLERAQEVVYQAFEATGREQVRLARQALEICPDCADAYVLLAEHAASADEAQSLYEQGVDAGRRSLGDGAFDEYAGHFWGVLETRPYMRARQGLANCLWDAGRREEAAAHYREMLRLNPNDNQGVRYSLATLLLDLGRGDELHGLLAEYKDDATADWAFTKVLAAFRDAGDTPQAREFLAEAVKSNRHVAQYLLGHKPLPDELPDFMTHGGADEAASYARGNRRAWLNTPGAITWLRSVLDSPLPTERGSRRPAWGRLKAALLGLPQDSDEIWQADVMRMGEAVWMVMIADAETAGPVFFKPLEAMPSPVQVWDGMIEAMRAPLDREPRRPARIEVSRGAYLKAWKTKASQIGVECELAETLNAIEIVRQHVSDVPGETARDDTAIAASAEDLLALPQNAGEVWQVDLRKMPAWVTGEGRPYRAWLELVVNGSDELVLGHRLTPEPPLPDSLWEVVLEAVVRPLVGEPHRPQLVEVNSKQFAAALQPHLERAEIQCAVCERLEGLDSLMEQMADGMSELGTLPSLLQVPGMRPEQVRSFYAAAADFYRGQPWQQTPGDTPIRVECDKFQSGPWFAVVMGQSGVEQGVAIYEDLEVLRATIAGDGADADNARRMSALSLMFSEAFELPIGDLDAAERQGWPVAGPEAYPLVLRINPGLATRPPLAWELELLEACLRAIPEFLRSRNDSAPVSVKTSGGDLSLRLAWTE
jgi:tetratricopeptide (TPR) repeat protein